jgi:hypothetical protein
MKSFVIVCPMSVPNAVVYWGVEALEVVFRPIEAITMFGL